MFQKIWKQISEKMMKMDFLDVLYSVGFGPKTIPNLSLSKKYSSWGPKHWMEWGVNFRRRLIFCVQIDPCEHFSKAAHTSEGNKSVRQKIMSWDEFSGFRNHFIVGIYELPRGSFFPGPRVARKWCLTLLKFVRNALFWLFQTDLLFPLCPREIFRKVCVAKHKEISPSHYFC